MFCVGANSGARKDGDVNGFGARFDEDSRDFVYGRASSEGVVDEQDALSLKRGVDVRRKAEGKRAADIDGALFPSDGRLTFARFFSL